MTNALVIDTCGETGYVALVNADAMAPAALAERRLGVRTTQEELLPAIEETLAVGGVTLHQLGAIAVVSGPGSFTGVRIGLAAAKGLSEAAAVPLITLSRLAVLAVAAGVSPIWAWLQAGRGDVYAALYRASSDYERHPMPGSNAGAVLSLVSAKEAARESSVAVCEETLRDTVPSVHFVTQPAFEQGLRNAAAAGVRHRRWADAALADALYLRVPDAELALRAKLT